MSVVEPYARWKALERDGRLGNDRRGRFKVYDVRKRTGCGCTSKRTVDEFDVTSGVVVRVVRRHLGGNGCRTNLQQKRRTIRRHETHGHISTKQQDDQQ
jgi:hypothetical protein